MLISHQWLLEFVDLEIVVPEAEALGTTLTNLGLAVDEIHEIEGDTVFELDVTTNRPDCMNHLGVARELAAFFQLQLREPNWEAPPGPSQSLPARVTIETPELCPRYAARVIQGVQIGPSPEWLEKRLRSLGQRPVNNVVDATNLVLFEMGHPLHAFDYDLLEGRRIVVRLPRAGEKQLTSLDDELRELEDDTLLICDAQRPVALAGVIGGEESEVTDATCNLLLESAYFNPACIRRTRTRLGLSTEASYRFERGADPEAPVRALNRCCNLILDLAGGACSGPVIDENPLPHQRPRIELDSERIQQVIGRPLDPRFVKKTLELLSYEVREEKSSWSVSVPGFRVDTGLPDDLVEDLLRHHGYEAVPSTYPPPFSRGKLLASQADTDACLQILLGTGFSEAVNLAFCNPESQALFTLKEADLVTLTNPMSEDMTHLRGTLAAGLLSSVHRNFNFGSRDVRLFELGEIFQPGSPPHEDLRLGVVATGSWRVDSWQNSSQPLNFFHLKGLLETIFEVLEVQISFRAQPQGFLHPGISAQILGTDGKELGWAGRLNPSLEQEEKLHQPIFLAEVSLGDFLERGWQEPQFRELDRFPSSQRDLSFLVDKGVEYGTMESAIKALNIPELQDIRPIDFYHGPKLPAGKKSLTIRLNFANPERTLRQEEIAAHANAVIAQLSAKVGAELRS